MRLNDALSQIADIRQQIARSQSFNGYRSLTTGLTGVIAYALVQVAFWAVGWIRDYR